MTHRRTGSAALSAGFLAIGIVAGATPSHAQGLFDMLFGGGVRQTRDYREGDDRRQPAPPKPRAAAPAKPAKISAPSYYTYRADPLVRVDFSGLPATTQTASLEADSVAPSGFSRALVHLSGFELFAEKAIAKAVVDHYAANPAFVFVSDGAPNERGRAVLRLLAEADRYGLDVADYSVAAPAPGAANDAADQDLIRFEMALAARALRYARDAHNGRIDPNRISGYHDFAPKPLDLGFVIKALATAVDARAILESQHPANPEYRALVAELQLLETSAENDIVVDPKTFVRPGGKHAELPKLLRLIDRKADPAFLKEHGPTLAAWWNSEDYDKALVPAIKAAQEKVGLKPDGVIGPRTVEALAGVTRADRIGKVVVALEQLRWLPSDLGSRRVFINQPAFTATYRENDVDTLTMRVVIGTPANQTSFFQDEIEQVDYNPYWGVPQSILVNEMLPRLRRDPGYLDRAGYEVTDSSGRRVPSSAVNWGAYGAKVPFNVRQTPSEANALGELKILFPNKHAIYMHDTPQKALFDRDTRAYSHGCVRLHDPRGMAAAVLGKPVSHVEEKLKRGHSSEKVSARIPVYVAYFTAWPDQSGKVGYFGDVYGRDTRVLDAIARTEQQRQPTG